MLLKDLVEGCFYNIKADNKEFVAKCINRYGGKFKYGINTADVFWASGGRGIQPANQEQIDAWRKGMIKEAKAAIDKLTTPGV